MILTTLTVFLTTLIVLIPVLVISFGITAAVVWALCWALNALGVTTICGFAVVFSWPLVLVIWLVWFLLRSIFGGWRVESKK